MVKQEMGGSVDLTVKRTAEAAGVVFAGVKPIAKAGLDNALLAGYLFLPKRSILKRAFGAAYFHSNKERMQGRQNYQ